MRAKRAGGLSWIFKHIARTPLKTALSIAMAMFFVFALGWLQESIVNTEAEVDRLYDTTVVYGELAHTLNPVHWRALPNLLGEVIGAHTIDYAGNHPYIDSTLYEAAHMLAYVVPAGTENWQDTTGFDPNLSRWNNIATFNFLLGVNDIAAFVYEQNVELVEGSAPGEALPFIFVEYLDGFEPAMFAYEHDVLDEPIPIVVPQSLMQARGLALGDDAVIMFARVNLIEWLEVPARIVGVHNGNLLREHMAEAVIIPIQALRLINGAVTLYTHLSFSIDTAQNRNIFAAQDAIDAHLIRNLLFTALAPMELFFHDELLMNVVGPMEQILLLLQLLYPVAVALAIGIGSGLSLLLMLQVQKNAAIMRVLGSTKQKTIAILFGEQMFVCIAGLAAALSAMLLMGWGFGEMGLLAIGGIYLAGAAAGSLAGTIIVTRPPPLELLQVRE